MLKMNILKYFITNNNYLTVKNRINKNLLVSLPKIN